MIVSSFGKPFCVGKEMHPLTLEALIRVGSKPKSFFVDFATSIGMYCYKHSIVALDFNSRISSNLSTKFAFHFPLLNSNKLMTPLPMWCKGVFSSLMCIPFFAHDDFFPSPQLPSYVENYAQILATCFVFPHTYKKNCDVIHRFWSNGEIGKCGLYFLLFLNNISLGFEFWFFLNFIIWISFQFFLQ